MSESDVIRYDGLWPYFVIPEGRVGIFQGFGGGFWDEIFNCGWGMKSPLTKVLLVNIRPQIDIIQNVPCGTSDGLVIQFPKVAVYNQLLKEDALDIVRRFGEDYESFLITEPIRQEIAELCITKTARELYIDRYSELDDELHAKLERVQDEYGSGLKINRVIVAKPQLPSHIQHNYEELVNQKSLLEVAVERQIRIMKEKEAERQRREKEAETERAISEIENQKQLLIQQGLAEQDKVKISVRIHSLKEEADSMAYAIQKEADAKAYQLKTEGEARAEVIRREAEINAALLTPAYIEKIRAESFWNSPNTKYFFGNQVPSFMAPGMISKTESSSQQSSASSENEQSQ